MPKAMPRSIVRHGGQRIAGQPSAGNAETCRVHVLTPRFHTSRWPWIVKPTQRLGSDRNGVDQRHGAVARPCVSAMSATTCVVPFRSILLPIELQSQRFSIDTHEVRSGGHVANLEAFARRSMLDDRHAVEHASAIGRTDHVKRWVAKPGFAAVAAQEHVKGQLSNGLFRHDDDLATLPVVGANGKRCDLPPQRRAVGVNEVQIERVAAVRRARDAFRLAPSYRDDRFGDCLIQHDRLACASLNLGVVAVVTHELIAVVAGNLFAKAAMHPAPAGYRQQRYR